MFQGGISFFIVRKDFFYFFIKSGAVVAVQDVAEFVYHHIVKFPDRDAYKMEAVIDAVFCVTGPPTVPGFCDTHPAVFEAHTGRVEGRTGLQDR